jgi:hypothetical protein
MTDTNTVITFSVVGFIGTFFNALYYGIRAYRNKTGPKINGTNKQMTDYSGHFEIDMLPAFVNLVTAMQYFGETIENYEQRFGFFNQYRYGSYLFTCPLMVYEICYTIGAPYRLSMTVLTFFTIMCALIADTTPTAPSKIGWFCIGFTLNLCFFAMLLKMKWFSDNLNKMIHSSTHITNDIVKQIDTSTYPSGIIRVQTPMHDKHQYITYAFYLMFTLWPIFPIMYVLEHMNFVMRNDTQVVFAVTDLFLKTMHSYYLDMYKHGLCETVVPYGFLDTSVLYDMDLTNTELDIYAQLKSLSRSIYGDVIIGDKGQINKDSNMDYRQLFVAGRNKQKVDDFIPLESELFDVEEGKSLRSPTTTEKSFDSRLDLMRRSSFRSSNSKIVPSLNQSQDKPLEKIVWH